MKRELIVLFGGSLNWNNIYNLGYRCKKVKITFEEIK